MEVSTADCQTRAGMTSASAIGKARGKIERHAIRHLVLGEREIEPESAEKPLAEDGLP
jgi:hypothetical protein